MNPKAQPLFDSAGVRAIDRDAIERLGIPGLTLMRRAGARAFAALRRRWPRAGRLDIVCGTGNNGGDGFVVAELAARAGLTVRLMIVGDQGHIRGDAATCLQQALAAGVGPQALADVLDGDCIVDALFGTGLDRAPAGDAARAIERINAAAGQRLALDIPSGLDASTGATPGIAVVADLTVSFIAAKVGLLTGQGPAHCGELLLETLDVPPTACGTRVLPAAALYDYDAARTMLTPRPRTAHKGHFGHVLVIGGAPGMAGAGRLAAAAAARSGAGLVSLATHPASAAGGGGRDEIMVHAIDGAAALTPLMRRASVVAIGPGLGTDRWGQAMFAGVRDAGLPRVVDADALNLLAADPAPLPGAVLTPHPGEAARLLACTTAEVQHDRLAAARELAARYDACVVLKGAGSVVAAPGDLPTVVRAGNPGMASGGMGDVLTGVIAAFVAQHLAAAEAAALGVCVHGHAADLAAHEDGERGLLAGDVIAYLRATANPVPS